MSGDYLSSKVVRWSPQRKRKKIKPFTGEVGRKHDVTKTSDNCPSKLDGEMIPSRFGI